MRSPAPKPPQPDTAVYPVGALNLFRQWSRADWAAAYEDPPTFDGSRHAKDWADFSLDGIADSTVIDYTSIEKDLVTGEPVVSTFSMTAAEARTPNIPGLHSFPAYVPKPTRATINGMPLHETVLSTRDQAVRTARALNLPITSIVEQDEGAIAYPADEPRRQWAVQWPKPDGGFNEITVGGLLLRMYANGVGQLGHWDTTLPEPAWKSDAPGSVALPKSSWPLPRRLMLDNEKVAPALGFMALAGITIYRTDMVSQYNPNPVGSGTGGTVGGGGTGGFTATDRIMLNAVWRAVTAPGKP